MNRSCFLKSILYGFIQAFSLKLVSDFVVSVYAVDLSFIVLCWFGPLLAILSCIVYFTFIAKVQSTKTIIYFSISEYIISIFLCLLSIVIEIKYKINFFPMTKVSNGHGIIILFIIILFVIISIILKSCIIIVLFIKNKKTK